MSEAVQTEGKPGHLDQDLPYPSCLETILPEKDDTYTGKKSRVSVHERAAIAYYVANEIIRDAGSVFFDAGSTLRMIARATFLRANEKSLSLIVTTNNIDIADDFLSEEHSPNPNKCDISLQLTGGKHDRQHHALFGELAALTLANIYPECIIMGLTGFSFGHGMFYHGATDEQPIKRALYSKEVDRRILAFDHTKLGSRDVFLCRNSEDKAIEGLSDFVGEKTIVVTSVPYRKTEPARHKKPAWERELDGFEKNKTIEKNLENGTLEVVAVSFCDQPPFYKVERHWPA